MTDLKLKICEFDDKWFEDNFERYETWKCSIGRQYAFEHGTNLMCNADAIYLLSRYCGEHIRSWSTLIPIEHGSYYWINKYCRDYYIELVKERPKEDQLGLLQRLTVNGDLF